MKKALIAFGILIICLVAFLWFKETKLFMVGMDGFMFPGDEVKNSLINGEDTPEYTAVEVSDIDEVYTQHRDYFVDDGERREKVSISLPVVSEDGQRILILDNGEAITDDFEKYTTFRGAVIADGVMYNLADSEQVDKNKYLFAKFGSDLFMNAFELEINIISGKNVVPKNSLIFFERNSLRYYTLNEDRTKYIFGSINGIDLKNLIRINEHDITYEKLLAELNVWKAERETSSNEDEPVAIITPEEVPEMVKDKNDSGEAIVDKMEVIGGFVSADTYAATFRFSIHDPNGELVRFPTVEIYDNGKVYSRKTFYASGEPEITGLMPDTRYTYNIYYTFRNKDDKLIQVTLEEGDFTTLGMEGIEPIDIQHGNIIAGSVDATIEDLRLGNNASDRVLRGLAKINLVVGDQEIKFGSGTITTLKRLVAMKYTTPSILKSNTAYHFEFKAYDVAGNELVVNNAGIDVKTTKMAPTAKLVVTETNFTWLKAKLTINNVDDVNIQNLRYVLLNGDVIIREGLVDDNMIIEQANLSEDTVYHLLVYGDYDLNDGQGNRINQILSDTNVSTMSISVLGNLRLVTENTNITKDLADYNVSINARTTDSRLINMLDSLDIDLYKLEKVVDENGRERETSRELVRTISVSKDDVDLLKGYNAINLSLDDLESKTYYALSGKAKIKQGDVEYDVGVSMSSFEFRTSKKPAVVQIIDEFTNSSMIDYSVRIADEDGAITSGSAVMRVERVNGGIVGVEEIGLNGEYKRFTYNKLENDATYMISFTVTGYNERFTDKTFESNKSLAVVYMVTKDGVTGEITLESLLRERQGINHYEFENTRRWKDVSSGGSDNSTTRDRRYDVDEGGRQITYLSVKNGWRYYSYYLPELAGKPITVSFDAKIEEKGSDDFFARVANDDSGISSCTMNNLSTERFNHYTCKFTLGSRGYVGFLLQEVSQQNRLTELAIRNLQIEEVSTESPYEKYKGKTDENGETLYVTTSKVNVVDGLREIDGNDFYIKIYRFGEFVKEQRYDLDENGEAVDYNAIFDVYLNSDYEAKLVVKINDVEYEISSLQFTTESEIRTVSSYDQFRLMHIGGKYYITEDLDLRGRGTIFNDFFGFLDFQGHKLYISDTNSCIFTRFYGTIKNADIRAYLGWNTTAIRNDRWGISRYNYGTVQDFMITLEEAKPVGTGVTFVTENNYGVIENFVVHLKASMYGIRWFSTLCLSNYNIVRNGYIYGDDGAVMQTYYSRSYEYSNSPKIVGALIAAQQSTGRLENVYTLLNMNGDINHFNGNYEYVSNLIGIAYAGSTMSHVYSNAGPDPSAPNLDLGTDTNASEMSDFERACRSNGLFSIAECLRPTNRNQLDINWYLNSAYNPNNPSNYTIEKAYYVAPEIVDGNREETLYYNNYGSTLISSWALRDVEFQKDTLNSYNAFDIDNYVPYGYYPHVDLPECMPNQDYIELPTDADAAPDIVSVISVEQESHSSALVTLNVRNKNGLVNQITDIKIRKLDTEIVEQSYRNGFTKLVVRVKVGSDGAYLSRYSVESISNGHGNPTTYGEGRRMIDVEMYREVSNVDDWKKIKNHLTENHILINDIDFTGVGATDLRIAGNFKGKLDGDGYTIKNIIINSGNSLIEYLQSGGIVRNINVENYTKTSLTGYAGLVGYAYAGSQILNVSLKNVSLLGSDYIGGLVGRCDGVTIQNSSVIDVSLYDISQSSNQTSVGGMIGYMSGATIVQNSFVRGVNFDIQKAPNVYTIGGLVGRLAAGTIDNVYTTGLIRTKTPSNGGIVGLADNSGVLRHAYSDVDIISTSDVDIGGIVGEATNPNNYSVSNTLSVGAIYSSLSDGLVRRIFGGDVVVVLPNFAWSDQHINGVISEETSGEVLISTADLNKVETYTQVMEMGNGFSYENIGNNSLPLLYTVDGTDLLPNQEEIKLKTYDFEITPEDITKTVVREDGRDVDIARIVLTIKNPNKVDIASLTIEDVKMRVERGELKEMNSYDEYGNIIGTEYYTSYFVEFEPEYYYDSYRISGLKYRENGIEYEVEKDTKLEVQFFRKLRTVDDWQAIEKNSSENYTLERDIDFSELPEGMQINDDLYINRLEGFGNGYKLSNININRNGNNVGLFHVVNSSLYNITFENVTITNNGSGVVNTGIVLFGYGSQEKLNFNNIAIKANGSDYVGIIADNYASDIRDVNINGVFNEEGNSSTSVSGKKFVGTYSGRIKPFSTTNVNIDGVKVTSSGDYAGAFAGQQQTGNYILQYGIKVNNSVVRGQSYSGIIYGWGVTSGSEARNSSVSGVSYVGGIAGRFNMSTNPMQDVSVVNSVIKGTGSYIGGISGYSDKGIRRASVKNSYVAGAGSGNVGGVSGVVNGNYSIDNVLVKDSYIGYILDDGIEVDKSGNNVGGICGNSCTVNNSMAEGIKVHANGNNIGGITGGEGISISRSVVKDAEVKGNGYVGGAMGRLYTRYSIQQTSVVNVTVSGTSMVGGLVGGLDRDNGSYTSTVANNTINSTNVVSSGDNAGGVIGYLNNDESVSVYRESSTQHRICYMYNNIVENSNVSAVNNAGGLVGLITVSASLDGLQPNRIYRNVVAASNVTTTNSNKDPGVFFGNDDSLAYARDSSVLRATDLKVYNGMILVKGLSGVATTANNYAGNNFNKYSDRNDKLVSLAQLKTQGTYTALNFGTGTYEYGQIASKYPYIKSAVGQSIGSNSEYIISGDMLLVDILPTATALDAFLPTTLSLGRMMTRSVVYHTMPKYTFYPSDVNTLNVEFSNIDEETTFTINGENFIVDQKVFSFNYNYDRPVEFYMTDGNNVEEKTFQPSDLRGNFATVGESYYILNNDGVVITNNPNYENIEATNIFKNKILAKSGEILNVKTGERSFVVSSEVAWIGRAQPLYSFVNGGSEIAVFANYSLINNEFEVDKQILIKGAQKEIINASVQNNKWQVIMDSYNSKDYLTILGDDNVLYDLKTKLTYPNNFERENIVEISNNVEDTTKLMIVKYKDGRVVVFNFRNGEVMLRLQSDRAQTPLEYFIEQVTSGNNKLYDQDGLQASMQSAEDMTAKIQSGTVVSSENEVSSDGDYVTSYDSVKDEYEIYDLSELLQIDPLGVSTVSVSDKIYGDNSLNVLFGGLLQRPGDDNVAAIVVFVGITVAIVISMIALGDLLRKKYSDFNKNVVK